MTQRFDALRSRWSRSFPPNLARLMLLTCAALWGGSYLLAKVAMAAIPPQWLMALRMAGACACMLVLFPRRILSSLNRAIVVPALVVGITYWGTMVTQTIGLKTIDPGRSAFLTAAYCVLTPFATWLVLLGVQLVRVDRFRHDWNRIRVDRLRFQLVRIAKRRIHRVELVRVDRLRFQLVRIDERRVHRDDELTAFR